MVTESEVEIDAHDEANVSKHMRAPIKDGVYFKITKLSCSATEFDGTARIVPSITTVTQTGLEQSRVPPRISSYNGRLNVVFQL
jgi:hypothetical protein